MWLFKNNNNNNNNNQGQRSDPQSQSSQQAPPPYQQSQQAPPYQQTQAPPPYQQTYEQYTSYEIPFDDEAPPSSTSRQTSRQFSQPPNQEFKSGQKQMYEVSSDLVKDRLGQEDSENLKILKGIDKSDLIVIRGSADQIENVLSATGIEHTVISPEDLSHITFKPTQTVYVNCHTSKYPPNASKLFAEFVTSGGQLITTDWTLNNILSIAFPGTINWNNQSTADEAVNIECGTDDDEILKSFKDEKLWYLAGGSHPITVLDPHKVKVLIRSPDLAKKHGGDAILVKFDWGEGTVYHMISHFALNMGPNKPKHATNMSTNSYARMKGASTQTIQKLDELEGMSEMNYANLQSATTNTEFVMRSAIKQKRKQG